MSKVNIAAANDALSPDFLDFVQSLNEHSVDYVLIGGYALGIHGVLRATADIDFLYRGTQANVRRLCAAMVGFGAPSAVINATTLMKVEAVTQFGSPPFRIDLLNTIDGVRFAEVWKGAIRTSVEGQSLRVIGLRELRKNKTASGRPKDRDDLRRLKAVKSAAHD